MKIIKQKQVMEQHMDPRLNTEMEVKLNELFDTLDHILTSLQHNGQQFQAFEDHWLMRIRNTADNYEFLQQ